MQAPKNRIDFVFARGAGIMPTMLEVRFKNHECEGARPGPITSASRRRSCSCFPVIYRDRFVAGAGRGRPLARVNASAMVAACAFACGRCCLQGSSRSRRNPPMRTKQTGGSCRSLPPKRRMSNQRRSIRRTRSKLVCPIAISTPGESMATMELTARIPFPYVIVPGVQMSRTFSVLRFELPMVTLKLPMLSRVTGLSDLHFIDAAIRHWDRVAVGFGVSMLVPTATNELLGTGQLALGAVAGVDVSLGDQRQATLSITAENLTSVAGKDDRPESTR